MIRSHNDWDPLEEIIVGTADYATLPTMNKSVQAFSYAEYTLEELKSLEGPHEQRIRDEANEDLDKLSKTLVDLGLAEAWALENYDRTTINYGHIESPYTPPKPNKLNQLNELNEKEFLKGL